MKCRRCKAMAKWTFVVVAALATGGSVFNLWWFAGCQRRDWSFSLEHGAFEVLFDPPRAGYTASPPAAS